LLELFQRTPGPVQVRSCIRKQLALDHASGQAARKGERKRPPLLHLWVITTGRPERVVRGYRLRPRKDWQGVWVKAPLDAMGLVVLSELPRSRDTLLLRLLGRGQVLQQAIADLMALPEDAKEREVAYEPLVALRFQVAQDPTPDEEASAVLMATQELYEQWKARVQRESETAGLRRGLKEGLEKGRAQGLKEGMEEGRAEGFVRTLVAIYGERFGSMPASLRKALAKAVDMNAAGRWGVLFGSGSPQEIAAAIRAHKAAD
jgi:hypothetical protein